MAVNYTLNWSDDTLKTPFTLVGGTIDTVSTSLALTGKSSVNWGERVQENLLHLLENFASNGAAPANPTPGQLWYNAAAETLSLYTKNHTWVVVYPQSGGGTSTATSSSASSTATSSSASSTATSSSASSTATSSGSGPTVYGIPASALRNTTITWGVTGGVPNTAFSVSASFNGGSPTINNYTLNSSGGFTSTTNTGNSVGTWNFTFVFAGGVVRSATTVVTASSASSTATSSSASSTATSSSASSTATSSSASSTATSSSASSTATSSSASSTATSSGGDGGGDGGFE